MQFAATVTRADVARATAYLMFRRRLYWCIPVLFYLLTLWGQWHSDQAPQNSLQALYFLNLYGLVWGGFYFVFIAYMVTANVFAQRKGVLGERFCEIRPDGLFETSALSETLTKWPAFVRIRRIPQMIIVFQSPWFFHFFVRRGFPDGASYDAFFRELRARIFANEITGPGAKRDATKVLRYAQAGRILLGMVFGMAAIGALFAGYSVVYFLFVTRKPDTPGQTAWIRWGWQFWTGALGYCLSMFGIFFFLFKRSSRTLQELKQEHDEVQTA